MREFSLSRVQLSAITFRLNFFNRFLQYFTPIHPIPSVSIEFLSSLITEPSFDDELSDPDSFVAAFVNDSVSFDPADKIVGMMTSSKTSSKKIVVLSPLVLSLVLES